MSVQRAVLQLEHGERVAPRLGEDAAMSTMAPGALRRKWVATYTVEETRVRDVTAPPARRSEGSGDARVSVSVEWFDPD